MTRTASYGSTRVDTAADNETRMATIQAALKHVRRASGGFTALCPAHPDRNSSLSVGRGRDGRITVKCFAGCSVTEVMSAIGLPMSMLFADGPRAHRPALSKASTPPVPARDDERKVANAARLYREARVLVGTPGAEYLVGRGIPTDLAHSNGVRYHSRFPFELTAAPAVVFPVYSGNRSGDLVGLSARFLHPERDTKGETQRSAGKLSWGLFGTRGVLNRPEIVITEAPIDALSLATAGVPAFATCGASNLRFFPKLYESKTIVCAFDLDADPMTQEKLRAAMDRLKNEHGGRVVWLKPPGNGLKDWNDVLCKHGATGLSHYLRPAGAKCRPTVLDWMSAGEAGRLLTDTAVTSASRGDTSGESIAEPAAPPTDAIPDQPADPCYCCRSRNWWFQEVSRSWVCARCHPDPRVLRADWERRKASAQHGQ